MPAIFMEFGEFHGHDAAFAIMLGDGHVILHTQRLDFCTERMPLTFQEINFIMGIGLAGQIVNKFLLTEFELSVR